MQQHSNFIQEAELEKATSGKLWNGKEIDIPWISWTTNYSGIRNLQTEEVTRKVLLLNNDNTKQHYSNLVSREFDVSQIHWEIQCKKSYQDGIKNMYLITFSSVMLVAHEKSVSFPMKTQWDCTSTQLTRMVNKFHSQQMAWPKLQGNKTWTDR